MPLTKERPWVLAALLGVVLLSVGLRLMPVLFLPGLNWDDEIFQATEPAHRLVFGYGIVAWEFQLGMRSWILPGHDAVPEDEAVGRDRKSTRLNSSHRTISYAVFCLKKK